MHFVRIAVALASLVVCLQAATLERLSLDEMIAKSTAIVRGRVISSSASLHGAVIYTHFDVQVLERWKGPDSPQVDVAVPGGTAGGLHQTFSGAPKLSVGDEYILFLWTGESGITHVIGFSQGVFSLESDGEGGMIAARAASSETMLDARTGRVVNDASLRVRLSDLRSRVSRVLADRTRR
jgi:hypothetical protein